MNKRKLLYMSTHRGCKEMDIILSHFAEKHLETLTQEEIRIYERLLSETDAAIYDNLVKIIFTSDEIDQGMKYAEDLLKKIATTIN